MKTGETIVINDEYEIGITKYKTSYGKPSFYISADGRGVELSIEEAKRIAKLILEED